MILTANPSRAALFTVVAVACIGAAPAVAQTASLIARWEFDGNYANSAPPPNPNFPGDYSLTPGGGVTLVPSPRGMAAEFRRATLPIVPHGSMSNPALDRLDTNTASASQQFGAAGFSVMGWVNPGGDFSLISHDSSSDPCCQRMGFGCAAGPLTDRGLRIGMRTNSDLRLAASMTGPGLPLGVWTHVAATWNGASDGSGFAFYVNGVSVPWIVFQQTGFTGLNGTDPIPCRIGASLGGSDETVDSWGGQVDHLSFWSGVLTPQQVLEDFGCTTLSIQPSPAIVCPGGTITLSVTAPSATAFQWQVEVPALPGTWVNLFDHGGTSAVAGSGTNTLTISNITRSAASQYRVVVTTPECGGPVPSTPATLYVGGPQCGCVADVDDGSGTGTLDGGVTIDDLLYFLQRFEAGC